MAATQSDWLASLESERGSIGGTSASERVAGALRTRIIEGELRPGTRLSEEKIGGALGVSRNTLREAFHVLGHERLVVHEFNRGVFVRALDADDIRDLYRYRRVLEGAAIRQAAVDEPDLTALEAAVVEGELAAAAEDWVALGSANMHFHRALAALAGSRRVDEAMQQVLAEMRLVFSMMADPHTFHAPYLVENQTLLDLLRRGRYEAAQTALAHYLDLAQAQLLQAAQAPSR
ncbi:GntR family transcriptional regulator [Janibacter sp. GS2]|uniref:GntR family transcriptional regulator n=1 Tax=Janibacter sp. GS2 TaxID=3442646 RepID=UPI003EBA3F4E